MRGVRAGLRTGAAAAAVLSVLHGPAAAAAAGLCDGRWEVAGHLPREEEHVSAEDVAVLDRDSLLVAANLHPDGGGQQAGGAVYHRDAGRWSRVLLGARTRVAAVAAEDGAAWLIGERDRQPLLATWTGSSWHRVAAGAPSGSRLTGVAMSARDDVWVSGLDESSGSAFVLHHDGERWERVDLPRSATGVYAVAATGPADAWAVGLSRRGPTSWHRSGGRWHEEVLTGHATGGHSDALFTTVTARDDGTVWAGGHVVGGGCCDSYQLVARHTATGWQDMTGDLRGAAGSTRHVIVGRRSTRPTILGSVFLGDGGGGTSRPVLAELGDGQWRTQRVRGYRPQPFSTSTGIITGADTAYGRSWAAVSTADDPLLLQRCGSLDESG